MSSMTRRVVIGVAALVLVGGAASAAAALSSGTDPAPEVTAAPTTTSSTPTAQPDTGIAVVTPSAPSARPVEPGPGDLVATDPTVPIASGAPVQVAITSADQVPDGLEVYGFVQGVVEDGGTCTATATRAGAADVVATSTAFADATTTVCAPVELTTGQLAAGTWNVVLGYQSPAHTGTSQPVTVEVTR